MIEFIASIISLVALFYLFVSLNLPKRKEPPVEQVHHHKEKRLHPPLPHVKKAPKKVLEQRPHPIVQREVQEQVSPPKIKKLFQKRNQIRNAVIYHEIISKPRSLDPYL